MTDQKPYEGWAIVELMGHQQIAGMISEQAIGGSSFMRVDVPELPGAQPFTKFYGGAAIYAITPTDEETATIAAKAIMARPVQAWVVPDMDKSPPLQLPKPLTDEGYDFGEQEEMEESF